MTFLHRVALISFSTFALMASAEPRADVVAVVSSKSPITSLSKDQVADLFLGRMSRLPNGALIVPVDQAEGSAAFDHFYEKIAGKSPAQIKAYWSKIIFTGRGQPPRALRNDDEVKKHLAQNPQAIGYIDEKMLDDSVRVLL